MTSLVLLPLTAVPQAAPSFVANLGVTAVVAFLPILAIAATSFLKLAVVLGILRSALGAPGAIPASVVTALAAVLSAFVMAPVADAMLQAVNAVVMTQPVGADPFGLASAAPVVQAAAEPLAAFLRANTAPSEIAFYSELADLPVGSEPSLRVLLPAFATGELVEAFLIGVLVFLPFLVVDLIVGSTLLALGLTSMSPAAVALPIKLLLFVVLDGWHIVLSGLLVTYVT